MTVTIFLRIQTPDFETWITPDPKAVGEMLTGQGALSYNLHRNLDDANQVISSMQFTDEAAAKAFKEWFIPIAAGHDQQLVEWWLGEDVPGYSSHA